MQAVSPVLKNYRMPEIEIGKGQKGYIPLPAIISRDAYGKVTTRWYLTWRERLLVLFTGSVYMQVLQGREKTHPVKLMVVEPTKEEVI